MNEKNDVSEEEVNALYEKLLKRRKKVGIPSQLDVGFAKELVKACS